MPLKLSKLPQSDIYLFNVSIHTTCQSLAFGICSIFWTGGVAEGADEVIIPTVEKSMPKIPKAKRVVLGNLL